MGGNALNDFVDWFQQHGTLDVRSMGIVDFLEYGRGAIALQDIPVRYVVLQLS